jgi:hypothetical protein
LASDLKADSQIEEAYVLNMNHGEFMIDVNNASGQKPYSDDKKIKIKKITSDIYEIDDPTILNENKEYNKLIKVNEDTLLRVKEIKLNLLDSKQIEKNIYEYDINSEMAKDIRNLSNKAQQKDSEVNKELIIYTPNFSKKSEDKAISIETLTIQSSYYYTGYNGYRYKDEIWYGSNSPTYSTIRTGYTVKDYFDDTLNNFCDFAIGAIGDALTGGAYTIVGIFANSPVLNYPSNSGDVWQAALNESKWRKYTSIEVWDPSTYQYLFVCRAVSDRSSTYFSHYLYRAYNATKAYSNDPQTAYVGKHYYETDKYAYLYMYDIPYTEYISKYSVNKYTNFSSQ